MPDKTPHWFEELPHPSEPVFNALLVIAVRLRQNVYQAIGTGFIWSCNGKTAGALSAAHVFEEIHSIQNPTEYKPQNYFFLPDPKKIDLDPEKVFAFHFDSNGGRKLRIFGLFFDENSDAAIFQVESTKFESRSIFVHAIGLDDTLPSEGTRIEGIGFKRLEFSPEVHNSMLVTMFRGCLTRRQGVVIQTLERTLRFSTPGIYASFPIFGGMSGGPVLCVHTGRAPAAFGILSSDYQASVEEKHNYFLQGCTTVAKLPIKWETEADGTKAIAFQLSDGYGTGA